MALLIWSHRCVFDNDVSAVINTTLKWFALKIKEIIIGMNFDIEEYQVGLIICWLQAIWSFEL